MSLEEMARQELLAMRKSTDGATVGAIARSQALLNVLGSGDPKFAYNALKHAILAMDSSTEVTAATYSLGFASNGRTHLDRLTDFGAEYGYDQRQARRYSDKGIVEIARYVASQWTVEASPHLELHILSVNDAAMEFFVRCRRFDFIEMRVPLVEQLMHDGQRVALDCEWRRVPDEAQLKHVGHVIAQPHGNPVHLTVLWNGETWPRFVVDCLEPLPKGISVSSLGARLALWIPTNAQEDERL